MKFAIFTCTSPACSVKTYEAAIDEDIYLECPECHQRNAVTAASKTITGRCDRCELPLEGYGHTWWHDQFIECRNKAK